MPPLGILLADDHELVRRGVRSLLALRPEWDICGEATDGREAVEKAKDLKPGLVLLDVSMPKLSGLEAARLIRQENPGIGIVFLSCHDSPGVIRAALDAGARGYVLKSDLSGDLLATIDGVSRGELAFSASLPRAQLFEANPLSPGRVAPSWNQDLRACNPSASESENDSLLPTYNHEGREDQGLRWNEQPFHALADSIPQLAWMADGSGWIFWYNQRWYDYTGTSLEEMQGWGWQKVHHPDHVARVVERFKRALEIGETWEDTFPLRGRDGHYRWFLSRALPLRNQRGQVVRWFGTNTDVTDQRQTEELLRESERCLRAAFSLTYAFVLLLTPEGTVLEANQAALQGTGFAPDEVIGRRFWEPWWSSLAKETEALKAGLLKAAGGETASGICPYCLRDGTRRFVDCTLSPVKDETGRVVMIVATGVDVTGRREMQKRLEERVNQRTADLKQAEERLRQLTARLHSAQDEQGRRIARELHDSAGQSVTALGLNLALMSHKLGQNNPDLAQLIEESRGIVKSLSKELRTISYLFHPPLLDEAGLAHALRLYVDGFSERSGLAVELEIPAELSRLPHDSEITIFRLVQECLTNIHRHSGSPSARVRIMRDSQMMTLEVQDRGRGMGAASKLGSANPGVGILGMRERVRQLGGQLEIQSGAGGTTVRAIFPARQSVAVASGARATQATPGNPTSPS